LDSIGACHSGWAQLESETDGALEATSLHVARSFGWKRRDQVMLIRKKKGPSDYIKPYSVLDPRSGRVARRRIPMLPIVLAPVSDYLYAGVVI